MRPVWILLDPIPHRLRVIITLPVSGKAFGVIHAERDALVDGLVGALEQVERESAVEVDVVVITRSADFVADAGAKMVDGVVEAVGFTYIEVSK